MFLTLLAISVRVAFGHIYRALSSKHISSHGSNMALKIELNLMMGKSAASFCHQVAAQITDMFCNYYFVKSHKIANSSATTQAR
jgi:hypothetical protein